MPEKSRERRVKVAARQGKATAIKSSDVRKAEGLSTHAAKKSSHVEGLRTSSVGRSVSRKKAPHESEKGPTPPPRKPKKEVARAESDTRSRPAQRTLSRRAPLAAKQSRKR
jgi:hypothetical protein